MTNLAAPRRPLALRALQAVVEVRADELRALLLACGYFFFILSSYYVLRPIRDEMGVAGGVDNLAWLFTGTLLATLAAQPFFGALVARYPRRRFIPYTYRFFSLNLLLFWALLAWGPAEHAVWVGRAFFVWVSVFNLGYSPDLPKCLSRRRLSRFGASPKR